MKAILHIGDQKTGSKGIQLMLNKNYAGWRDKGVISPKATKGGTYDIGLGAVTKEADSHWCRTYMNYQGIPDHSQVDAYMRRNLQHELENMNTAIFSFEGLLWLTSNEIATLKAKLSSFFDDFEIVVFLRRQDRKAVSLYSTKLLLGRGRLTLLPDVGDFDYHEALARWREHYSKDAFTIHVYEEEPDTARALARHLGEGLPIEYPDRQNEALGGKAQEVLKVLRTGYQDQLPPGGQAMELRAAIKNAVKGGLKAMPSEAAARAFMKRFEAGNKQISDDFFLNRHELFDEDYDEYRREDHPIRFTADDMAQLALALGPAYDHVRRSG